MMAAAAIGEAIGVTPPEVRHRQRALFERYRLPLRHPGVNAEAVFDAIALDKKVAARRVRWVLLEDFGRATVRDDVPDAVVREALSLVLPPVSTRRVGALERMRSCFFDWSGSSSRKGGDLVLRLSRTR